MPALAQSAAPMVSPDGALLPVKVDGETGKILITLPPSDANGVSGRFLYATAIKTGLGSGPIRIDHGMLGETRLLSFRRLGRKIAVVFENPRYISSGDETLQRGAHEDFPFSTVALLDVVASAPGGAVTVDIAPFLTRDTMQLAAALNAEGKGFKLAEGLSVADPRSVKVFPDNIEMDAIQTYASDTPGKEVETIAPDGRQVSFTVHHSLIRLPGPGFVPRKFDIRSGSHATQVYDFNTPLGSDVLQQYANHFRLEKTDPNATRSPVKKPIVFYIDNAAPEPIRTALAEGVSWWNQAFDAAGFIDAFQVKILPPGVDPQDVRYNIVNWDERQTRSWSYGGGITDPRTGEIIKGNVVLEGLRPRQDVIIFEGLVGTARENSGDANDPVRVALARIRQLGAHEVGHAIGFVHNFQGSTQGRTSVMDYPFAKVELKNGKIDLSDAYASGIGSWDKFTVDWLYGTPKPGIDPDADAARKAAAIQAAGMRYMTDIDGRDPDLAVPGDNMWTEGSDQPADLEHVMAIRKVALANFGPGVLHQGEPLSDLRRKFVPIWLFHRYAVTAIGKLVGGVNYTYAVAGDSSPTPTSVSASDQKAALDALLATLAPEVLTISPQMTMMLSSGVNGRGDPQFDTEVFDTAGASVFDPLVATDVAAQVTLDTLLSPSRLARVNIQHTNDASLPGLTELLGRITSQVIDRHTTAVEQRIALRAILSMAKLRRTPATPVDVAVALAGQLDTIAARFAAIKGEDGNALWCRSVANLLHDNLALDREIGKVTRHLPDVPPGMPIG